MLTRAIAFVAAGVAELGKLVDPNSAYPPDYERDGQRGLENGGVAPQSLQMQTGGRNETNAAAGSYRYARAKRTLYTREYQLRVCPALNDELEPVMVAQHHQKTTAVAASLAYTGDSLSLGNRNASVHMERERIFDIRDIDIDLSSLLSQANRVSDENDDDSVQTIEGGNRAILIELAIVVIDPLWSTDQVYFRITVQNVAPRCALSTHVFGNHEAIVVRSATASSSTSEERQQHKQQAPPHGVSCKANRSSAAVDGWCLQCGLEPTAFPLYQTVLSDDELVKFAEEICAANGTHDHVLHTTPNNDMLEVQSVSTIARLVGAKNRQAARPELAVVDPLAANSPVHGTGVTFVEREAWCAEVAEARQRFLGNLPLSDLSRAKIRIGARGSPTVGSASIGIILTAQTMEFVQQGAAL